MPSNKPPVSDVQFVTIWQMSNSLAEAAQALGYTSKYAQGVVNNRARRMRKLGVKLKWMRGRDAAHIARLNRVVKRVEARK